MKNKDLRPDWFNELVDRALKKFNGNVAALAAEIDIPAGTVKDICSGKTVNPGINCLEPILNLLNAPLPGKDREIPNSNAKATPVRGHVAAGLMSWPGDGSESTYGTGEFIHIDLSCWNKMDQHCTKNGSTFIVKIEGDSMFPDYNHGDLLICKQWNNQNPDNIKKGTPCIFEQDGQYTFKLLRRDSDGVILGEPINKDYDFITFKDNFDIPYLVVGRISGTK